MTEKCPYCPLTFATAAQRQAHIDKAHIWDELCLPDETTEHHNRPLIYGETRSGMKVYIQ
jgi:hypothetical protein